VFTTTATTSQLGDIVRHLTDGTYEYRKANGDVIKFDSTGKLTSMVDRNGNTTVLTYTGALLTRITDPVGRSITLDYNSANRVIRATDSIGHSWQYSYVDANGNATPRVTSVTDPLGKTINYTYTY